MPISIDLRGRNAVVTGAGKGIGRAICIELARAGANVFAISRTRSDLLSLEKEVGPLGVRFLSTVADLREFASIRRSAEQAESDLGPIDILVNNAGIAITGPAEVVSESDWDAVNDSNVKSAFFCAQAFGQAMLKRGHGRIVNITSQAGVVGLVDHAAYCASKAALGMITKVLAIEWGPRGVTVNAIAPTVVLTPLGQRVWGDPAKGEPMLAKIPVGRFGEPEEVAYLVAYLASDMAAMINGETILLDGGYSAQ